MMILRIIQIAFLILAVLFGLNCCILSYRQKLNVKKNTENFIISFICLIIGIILLFLI